MPYIPEKDRPRLDPLIDRLVDEIVAIHKEYGYDGAFAGLLNYTQTRLSTEVATKLFGRIRYWLIAILVGVFKNIADEFYRRIAVPYEDVQTSKNGDVDSYEEMIENIKLLSQSARVWKII